MKYKEFMGCMIFDGHAIMKSRQGINLDFGEIKCQKNLMKNMKNAADGEMHGMSRCGSAKKNSR